jgi:hypothetical protein
MTSLRVRSVFRQAISLASAVLLTGVMLVAQQPPPPPQAPAAQAPAQQLLSPEQLDTLVAPVALYPYSLLSQVMVASTYPLEIVEVGQWLQQNRNLQGSQLVDAARQQNWDPSIQALVVFPDVVGRLNADIHWTTDLGNAFLAQQADVMNAVQRMRSQAMASGKLRSDPQETVTTEMQGDRQAIDIQPANPEEVYVPYYDPAYVWGPPAYSTPKEISKMKKIMTLMLGLSFLMGTVSLFAQDKPADAPKTDKKAKKSKKKKAGSVLRPVRSRLTLVRCGRNAPNCRAPEGSRCNGRMLHQCAARAEKLSLFWIVLLPHVLNATGSSGTFEGAPVERSETSEGAAELILRDGERSFIRERERHSQVVQRSEGLRLYPALHRGRCVRSLLCDSGERLPHAERGRNRGV